MGLVGDGGNTIRIGKRLLDKFDAFAGESTESAVTPVTFDPGRERLATRPASTGSPLMLKTSGTEEVTAFAPKTIGPWATMTSTPERINSVASSRD